MTTPDEAAAVSEPGSGDVGAPSGQGEGAEWFAADSADPESVVDESFARASRRARNSTHPERDEQGRRTRPWMQWPTLLVLAVVACGLLVIALGRFRAGAVVIAAGALLALFLRVLLEPSQAGWLVNRSRWVDVACLGVLGVGLAILAFAVPAPS